MLTAVVTERLSRALGSWAEGQVRGALKSECQERRVRWHESLAGGWMHVTPSLPLTEHTVAVEGLPIYYRTGGSGPPLLLLHGFTQVGRLFDPYLDELGKHYTVIVPDFPGHGRSPRFASAQWSFRATARLLFEFLDNLGVGQVRGIGLSLGAIVLLCMAAQRPDRVVAVVFSGGGHRLPEKGREDLRGWRWEDWAAEAQEQFLRRHPGGVPQAQAILAQLRGLADDYDWELSPEHLATLPTRFLVVMGDRDELYPTELSVEMYRALPNAALWVIPGEGHGALWSSEEAIATFPTVARRFFQGDLTG